MRNKSRHLNKSYFFKKKLDTHNYLRIFLGRF